MTTIERRALALETLKRTLVAFLFGFFLSAVFALAIAAQFSPLVKLERESSDFGLRIANAVFGDSADSVPKPAGASPIVMIDIDAEACAKLASANACNFDRMVQPEVVEAVMEVIETVAPKVAVLDILVTPEAGAALAEAMTSDGPPLLTAMELSEFEDDARQIRTGYLLGKSLCGAQRCGRLEYLPARARIQDGKARNYERAVPVSFLASLEANASAPTDVETLAYRAAKLAAEGDVWNDGSLAPPIGYTIPSFALGANGDPIDEERRASLRATYGGNVEHYRLSTIKPDRDSPVEIAPPPAGTILIIGSTALSGGDLHNTPLGPLGGMEVVANAIRSFQIAAPQEIPSASDAFFIKIGAVMKALAIIAAVEALLAYFTMRREATSARGQPVVGQGAFWDRWSLPILLTMLFAFAGEFLITMWEIISQFNEEAGSAAAVDVIWPIVGVSIGAIIGFSGEIIAKIEWIVDRAFALPARFVSGK